MDVGAFVHLYAKEFVHTDVRLALEYYIAAARLQVPKGYRNVQVDCLYTDNLPKPERDRLACRALILLLSCPAVIKPLIITVRLFNGQGDSRETRGRLLRELLTESQAYGACPRCLV